MKKSDYIKLAVLLFLVIIAYIPTFIWMVGRWTARDTYYSHGFLVPFISLFIIWIERNKLSKLKIAPAKSGWLFFILGLLIHTISGFWRVYFTSGFSFLIVIAGLVLLFLGKEFLKNLIFPISFLLFMIPLPMLAIANLSFRLKIFAAQISTFIINNLGVSAVRDGSVIKTMHSYLVVEDPCSGIRSLIALIALGILMAYFNNFSKVKKGIIFLSSIPIAITTNIIRIVALSLASEMYGTELAMGMFHDVVGILIFVFAFLGLSLVGKLLE